MKMRLEHLAHVRQAVLEDGRTVIIVGDNGAGKTLLLEAFSFIKGYYQRQRPFFIKNILQHKKEHFSVQMNIDELDWEDEQTSEVIPVKIKAKNAEILNEKVKEMVLEDHAKVIQGVNEQVLLTKKSSFSFTLLDLELFKSTEWEYQCKINIIDDRIFLRLMDGTNILRSSVIRIDPLSPREDELMEESQPFSSIDPNRIKDILKDRLLQMFIGQMYHAYFGYSRTLYLPSERNLFMDNALEKAALDLEKGEYDKRRYSERLFTASYLRFKDDVETYPQMTTQLAPEVEKLFQGKIKYGEDGEILSIILNDGTEIRRELFSTKQNRMIPYLLIHHARAMYRDIIIEEPEAHLSLKSQLELLQYLQPLLESERRNFYITTHSDVFFAFLNNMLLENKAITAKVYELIREEKGTYILEEKEQTEYGYEIKMFTDILNKLYDETLAIQKKINHKR